MEKPAGVWVVSILFFIGGALGVLGGLMMLLGGGAIGVMGGMAGRGIFSGAILGFVGFVTLILAVFELIVGWGVLTLQLWARIVGIILAIISLLSIPIGTIIGLVILYFLVLDKATVAAFQPAPPPSSPPPG